MRPPRHLLSAPPSTARNSTTTDVHGSTDNSAAPHKDGNTWGQFGNGATYGADMALAVGILLSGFVLGLLLMVAVRLYLRRRRGARAGDPDEKPERGPEPEAKKPSEPPTVYSAGKTELAGAAAECAICLSEFVDGEALRVLRACKHGFHVQCVERWLASSPFTSQVPWRKTTAPSCPMCRASCLPPGSAPVTEP
ncbi:hypothetical protein Taro_032973 [Colocasia esculenta]|uniref:RING-type domain-containing protein n=1 Tax=Colocasia esculenta TaxID=4460 RepID=A0A843VMN1_COLES|nr:hypothetical protein [Colocasia esculenta]